MGSRSQRKGAAGERELAALLSAAGYECQPYFAGAIGSGGVRHGD